MITYKPIIIQGGRRKDGTYPVKIRVTFKGVSRRLPTTLVALDCDLTHSGQCPRMPAEGLAEKSDNYGTKTAKIMGPSVMEGPTLYTFGFPGVSGSIQGQR